MYSRPKKSRQRQQRGEQKGIVAAGPIFLEPASPAQEAEIAGLQRAITDLTYQKLRLYSMLFTLFFPAYAVNLIGKLMIRWGDPEFNKIEEGFRRGFHDTEDLFKDFISGTNQFCDTESIPRDKCLLETAKIYDQANDRSSSYISPLLGYKVNAKKVLAELTPYREILRKLTLRYTLQTAVADGDRSLYPFAFMQQLALATQANKKIDIAKLHILLAEEIDKDSFQQLVKKMIRLRTKTLSKGNLFFLNYISDIMTDAIRSVVFPLFILSLGVQRYLVEPVTFSLYRRYYDKPLHQLLAANKRLNSVQAKEFVTSLTDKRAELKKAAENNSWYARRLLMFMAIGFLLLGTMFDLPVVEAALFLFSLTSVASYNSFNEAAAWNRQRQFNSVFNTKLACLNSFIPEWEAHKKAALAESFFVWHAQKRHNISAYLICRFVKNSLVMEGLGSSIIYYGLNTLVVSADINLNAAKAKTLNEAITKICRHYNQLKLFKQQLLQFGQHIAPYQIFTTEVLQQSAITLKVQIPEHLRFLVTENAVRTVFPSCKVFLIDNILKITGHTPAEESLIMSFIDKITQGNLEHSKRAISTPAVFTTKEVYQRIPKGRAACETKLAESKIVKKPDVLPQLVCWKSGVFDSKKEDCKIIPYSGKNKFLLFNLEPEDFLDELSGRKFFAKVDRQKLAAAFSSEGWRHYHASEAHYEKDNKGKWFRARFDIKVIGKFGKIRLYGDKEKDATGRMTLYVIKGINNSAH